MVLFYYWICTLNILKSMFPFLLSAVLVFDFLQLLIYSLALERNDQISHKNLDKAYKEAAKEDLALLQAINDTIVNSELFPSLSNLPWIGNLDVKDLKSLATKYQKMPVCTSTIFIATIRKKGTSLALNQIANKNRIESLIAESMLLSEHIYYSPMKNQQYNFTITLTMHLNRSILFTWPFSFQASQSPT